jgi:hypothetical protein
MCKQFEKESVVKKVNFAITLLMIWSFCLIVAHDYQGMRKPATTHKPIVELEIIKERDLSRSPAISFY